MDHNAAPVNHPSVAMMLDEEDKMFRDALIESQKEYAAFLDAWPTFSDYTKPSYEGLENAIKQKEAETISKIESSRGRSSTVNRK
ncbi:BnaA06g39240D [Brassica napus]|uniref:(rape) hypothetical protein n=1 Tax=Brassica napus TaxID=3708 RepID=A0A078JI79_BRANA|nr:unnamed protein product [Brassica napus]CDY66404.1 BnaA06g39240D [Brassica napus]